MNIYDEKKFILDAKKHCRQNKYCKTNSRITMNQLLISTKSINKISKFWIRFSQFDAMVVCRGIANCSCVGVKSLHQVIKVNLCILFRHYSKKEWRGRRPECLIYQPIFTGGHELWAGPIGSGLPDAPPYVLRLIKEVKKHSFKSKGPAWYRCLPLWVSWVDPIKAHRKPQNSLQGLNVPRSLWTSQCLLGGDGQSVSG